MAARSTLEQKMGARIKALRAQKQWTLAELGRRVGLTKQGIYRIERGEVGSAPSQYEEIARALGVTLADLLPKRASSRCTCPSAT